MPAPKKRDYTEIAPAVVESYLKERNVLKVSRLFSMSPRSVKAILDEHHVKVGRSGANNLKHHNKKAPMPQDCCYFCHKYSKCSPTEGYCFKHRRSVSAKNREVCFV